MFLVWSWPLWPFSFYFLFYFFCPVWPGSCGVPCTSQEVVMSFVLFNHQGADISLISSKLPKSKFHKFHFYKKQKAFYFHQHLVLCLLVLTIWVVTHPLCLYLLFMLLKSVVCVQYCYSKPVNIIKWSCVILYGHIHMSVVKSRFNK